MLRERDEEFNIAASLYTQAIELAEEPVRTVALINRGVVRMKLRDLHAAISDFSITINEKTAGSLVYYNRGLCYSMDGNTDQAFADFEQALNGSPDADTYVSTRRQLGMIHLSNKNYEKAAEYFKDALEVVKSTTSRSDVSLRNGYALALRGLGQLSHALMVLQPAILNYPRHVGSRMCYGAICYDQAQILIKVAGREKEAQDLLVAGRRSFQAALHMNPTLAPARINLAFSFQAQGRMSQAWSSLTCVLAEDPSNATALEGRAIVNLLCGNTSGALADVTSALQCTGNSQVLSSMLHTTRSLVNQAMSDFAAMQSDVNSAVLYDANSFHAQVSIIVVVVVALLLLSLSQ